MRVPSSVITALQVRVTVQCTCMNSTPLPVCNMYNVYVYTNTIRLGEYILCVSSLTPPPPHKNEAM